VIPNTEIIFNFWGNYRCWYIVVFFCRENIVYFLKNPQTLHTYKPEHLGIYCLLIGENTFVCKYASLHLHWKDWGNCSEGLHSSLNNTFLTKWSQDSIQHPSLGFKYYSTIKEISLLGEMANSRSRSGNIQNVFRDIQPRKWRKC
jgi:hypothetical protein